MFDRVLSMPLDFISKTLECTRTHTQFVTVDPNCTKDPYTICYSGSFIVQRTHTQFVIVDPDCTKDSYTFVNVDPN